MRALVQRTAILLAVLFVLNSGAFGYYYYVHFAGRAAPYNPIYEKFDVNALKHKTVYFFIADNGPAQLANTDSFGALVSELRLAAKTWNDIDSSDLRIAFGGLATAGTPQNGPGIDVVFDDDIPPGIAALGGPTVRTDLSPSPGGNAFVPITRSTLKLRRDLRDLPSFSENGFTTLVHEFGHTLGLQHTLTSGTMSTAITRATTRSKPLSADDVAAMSVLYPAGAFLANTGSVSGRVTMGGSPVNLASVVVISSNGPAISGLTNPDGTYTIQGIPAGQSYNLYVHPLPPKLASEAWPANIVPPKDPDGFPQPAGFNFDTIFFPGVKDPNQAASFFMSPGDVKSGMNFSVTRRDAPGLASIYTYGFYGSNPVYPAPLAASGTGVSLIAKGDGLVNGTSLAPGLTVSVLGQSGANVMPQSVKYYTSGYIVFGVAPTFGASPGPRHLVFAANNDIYVLPAGVLIVSGPPPSISAVTPTLDDRGSRAALISGSGMDSSTRVMFDGVAATVIRQNGDGSLLVTPPPASGGFRSSIVALNSEGQSSLFVQPAPPAYVYDGTDVPGIIPGLAALTAGSESMIEILGVNTSFVDGQTIPGFGSSDVSVRRVWVTGPNRLLANIAVNPAAIPAAIEITVASGLQLINQPFAFQVLPAAARQVSMIAPVSNAATGSAGVPAGGTALVSVSSLTSAAGALGITVADQKATILSAANGQITFIVPPGLPVGPAVVRLQTPAGDPVPPLVMNIDPQPPQIINAFSAPGTQADSSHPAFRGSLTGFLITGLPDPQTLPDPSVIRMNIGGLDHAAVSLSSQPGGVLAQILLNPAVAAGNQVPVTVSYNGAVSQPFAIPVR